MDKQFPSSVLSFFTAFFSILIALIQGNISVEDLIALITN